MSVVWSASPADARLLNLIGEFTLEYRLTDADTAEGNRSGADSLREIVRAGTGGELFREAIGRYSLNMSFVNEDRWIDGTGISIDENRQVLDFFLSLGLFPHLAPLSMTGQRTTQDVQTESGTTPFVTGETTITTFSLTWALPRIWKLPQLNLNLYYSVSETNSCTPASPAPCDDTSRVFGGSISASDQYPYRYIVKNTELNWSLAFSSSEQFSQGAGLNVAGRVTADSQWTSALKSSLRASYSTGVSSQTSKVPGGMPTATTAGATFFYRPSLKLNSSIGYDFTRDTFDRHVGGIDVFYRPTPQFDLTGTGRATYLDLDQSQVASGFASGVMIYRPMLNLTTSAFGTLGVTSIANSTLSGVSMVVFQSYGGAVNYFKLYDLVRLTTGAGLDLGNTVGSGLESTTFNSNWMAQVTNTKTQYVTVTGGYNGNYSQQSGSGKTNLLINTLRADATSSYFRELLLRGDALTLHLGGGNELQTGADNNKQTADLGADGHYGWRGIGVGSGYSTRLTTEQGQDYNVYFFELQWTVPPFLPQLALQFRGRYEELLVPGDDRTNATADAMGSYQIGQVQFSLQYLFNYTDQTSWTMSHNLYLKLTRRFSI